jgi:hypothetical protein
MWCALSFVCATASINSPRERKQDEKITLLSNAFSLGFQTSVCSFSHMLPLISHEMLPFLFLSLRREKRRPFNAIGACIVVHKCRRSYNNEGSEIEVPLRRDRAESEKWSEKGRRGVSRAGVKERHASDTLLKSSVKHHETSHPNYSSCVCVCV